MAKYNNNKKQIDNLIDSVNDLRELSHKVDSTILGVKHVGRLGCNFDRATCILYRNQVSLREKDIIRLCGVSYRTVQRYRREGILIPTVIRGDDPFEKRFSLDHVIQVFELRDKRLERGGINPVTELWDIVDDFRSQMNQQQAIASEKQMELQQLIETQNQLIEQLACEQRDTVAKIDQLREQILMALSAPRSER
jgi:phage terminase Nu1 subunit (DNA packaging protein)